MKNQKRGKNVAMVGLFGQLVVAAVLLILWRMTDSRAMLACLWLPLGGVALWAITAILFYARQLEHREEMELQELTGGSEDRSIFQDRGQLELRPAAQRVEFLKKWIVPAFTLLFAAYNGALAILTYRMLNSTDVVTPVNSGQAAMFLVILAFGVFLLSRYCTGMASRGEWRLLRTPGSYLLVCVLFMALIAVVMLLVSQGNDKLELIVSYILPAIQLVFAIELTMNFILAAYRPRLPGEEYVPSYDSRLFNLLAEPARIGYSIADTINYQFGFEVSRTWFYQLLARAVVPLVVFAILVIFALSSVVIVRGGEQYVLKHWGQLRPEPLGPGVHFKWPWPIDTAERFNVGMTHELVLGVGDKKSPKFGREGQVVILWTEEHGYGARRERDFLIGVPPRQTTRTDESGKAPSVSIIKLVVVVQYHVTDMIKYGYKVTDVRELLECICDQEMVRYCASATLDTRIPGQPDRPQAIMTHGRTAAAEMLKKRIQDRIGPGGLDLGVEISFVGIVSAHPPADAVPQFEKVLEAERLQDQQRYKAEAEAARILAEVSGNPGDTMELFLALRKAELFEELTKLKSAPGRFASVLGEAVHNAKEQIKALDLEIHRERLLGKTDKDMSTRLKLRDGYLTLLTELQKVRKDRDGYPYADRIAEANERGEKLFARLEGTPAKLIAEARSKRWQKELGALTKVQAYRRKLLPFEAAPRVYMFDQYMDVLDETLPGMLKYVMGVDPNRVEVRVNLEQQRDIMESALEGSSQP
jgi:regulator of protease activity HflC (stomatin/prohibitin superfamily)